MKVEQIRSFSGQEKVTRSDVENYLNSLTAAPAGTVRATPAARRVSRNENVELANLSGSGPRGRIQAVDVQYASEDEKSAREGLDMQASSIPLNNIRKTIARNMAQSWQEIPQMTLQADINVGEIEAYRADLNAAIGKKQRKITITALITKAVAVALERNRILNSQFSGNEIILNPEINIGIATALEDGLIVPVVKNANQKTVESISNEIRDLSERARAGKLSPDQLSGGTFTISNLGMFEIDRFTAIINPPQAAILAVGKKNRVFSPAEDNAFHVEEIITFTLSADHRVMDGVQAARFLADLKATIQNLEALKE